MLLVGGAEKGSPQAADGGTPLHRVLGVVGPAPNASCSDMTTRESSHPTSRSPTRGEFSAHFNPKLSLSAKPLCNPEHSDVLGGLRAVASAFRLLGIVLICHGWCTPRPTDNCA